MSDTTDTTRQGRDDTTRQADASGDLVMSVADAAVLLGISPGAVRKRIERGQLAGHKAQGGTWRVVLSATDTTGTTRQQQDERDRATRQTRQTNTTESNAVVSDAARSQLATIREALLQPLIEQNERQQATISSQAERIGALEERSASLERERNQLREALERAQSLAAPVDTEVSSQVPTEAHRRSWRIWEAFRRHR